MSHISYKSVYEVDYAPYFLYVLLEQREPHQSISHKAMPTIEEHFAFIASHPYAAWHLIDVEHVGYVGAIYLTRQREIGIWIHRDHGGHGYAKQAIRHMMERHPGRFLANINPNNEHSQRMFESIGFKRIQNTFSMETT